MTSTLDDLDKLLKTEASAFQREVEVERILAAFKLNPYDVFDLDGKATPEEIKKKYRQISLCKYLSHNALRVLKCHAFDGRKGGIAHFALLDIPPSSSFDVDE
jgi:hypothetical protein